MSQAARVRTQREFEFGEIVEPFTDGEWTSSYYGGHALSGKRLDEYSPWITLGNQGQFPANNPISHMDFPDRDRYFTPRAPGIDSSGTGKLSREEENMVFFTKEYEKGERIPT